MSFTDFMKRITGLKPQENPTCEQPKQELDIRGLRDIFEFCEFDHSEKTYREITSAVDEFYSKTKDKEATEKLVEDILHNYGEFKAEKSKSPKYSNFGILRLEDYFIAVSGRIRESLAAHSNDAAEDGLAEIIEDEVSDFTSLVYHGMANMALPLEWAANTADNASVLYSEFEDKEKFVERMGNVFFSGRSHPLEISVTEAMGSWCEGDKEKEKRFIGYTVRALESAENKISLDLAMSIAGEMLDADDSMYEQAKEKVLADWTNIKYIKEEIKINEEHGFMSGKYPLVMNSQDMDKTAGPFSKSRKKLDGYLAECMLQHKKISSARSGNKEHVQKLGEQYGVFPTQQEIEANKIRYWQKERKRKSIIGDEKQLLILGIDDSLNEIHEAFTNRVLDDYFSGLRGLSGLR